MPCLITNKNSNTKCLSNTFNNKKTVKIVCGKKLKNKDQIVVFYDFVQILSQKIQIKSNQINFIESKD